MAAGAGGVGEDVVVEEDRLLGKEAHGRELALLSFRGSGLIAEAGVFAPGLDVADFGKEGEGEQEQEYSKKHIGV